MLVSVLMYTLEFESTTHFFLHCHYYNNICETLLDDLKLIDVTILKLSETALPDLLLYGEASFDIVKWGKNGMNLANLSIICYLLCPSLPHFLVLINWSLAFMNK